MSVSNLQIQSLKKKKENEHTPYRKQWKLFTKHFTKNTYINLFMTT